jgi:hypothetical protein
VSGERWRESPWHDEDEDIVRLAGVGAVSPPPARQHLSEALGAEEVRAAALLRSV